MQLHIHEQAYTATQNIIYMTTHTTGVNKTQVDKYTLVHSINVKHIFLKIKRNMKMKNYDR